MDALEGIPENEMFCEKCPLGKAKDQPMGKAIPDLGHKTTQLLGRVYTDTLGPLPVQAIGGYWFAMVFVDEALGGEWVYLLKSKKESLAVIRQFEADVADIGKVQIYRSDWGTEYT